MPAPFPALRHFRLLVVIVILVVSTALSGLKAATHTWTGAGGNNLWSNTANWTGGKPASNESGGTLLTFGTNTTSTCDIAGLAVSQIYFSGGGNTVTGTTPLTINGSLAMNNIVSDAGTNLLAAALPLVFISANCFVTVSAGTLTLAGNMSSSGAIGLRKLGPGTLMVTGNNSYTGLTTAAEGTLGLNSFGTNNAVPGNLTIGGTGPATASAVLYQSFEIADSSTITVNATGAFTMNGFTEIVGALTLNGGSVTVSASNSGKLTVNGNTIVDKGTINLGAARMTQTGALTMTGGSITAATGGLLTLAGDVAATASAVDGAYITSAIVLIGTRSFTVNGGISPAGLTVEGIVSESALATGMVKAGSGTMKLLGNASNTFTGTTAVTAGMLQLRTNNGRLINGPLVIGNNTDPPGSAVVQELLFNDINSTSAVTINASGVLDLNNHSDVIDSLFGTGSILMGSNSILNVAGTPASAFAGSIAGPGIFTRSGDGSITLTGNIQSAVRIRVDGGTIIYNPAPGSPRPTDLRVGDGSGAAASATLRLAANNLLPGIGGLVAVFSDGRLDLNNTITSVGPLNIYGGSVTLGTGQLTTLGTLTLLAGSITSTNPGVLYLGGDISAGSSGPTGASISGDIALNISPVITVSTGATPDFTISSFMRNGAPGSWGFTKSGPGTLRYNGPKSNTFTGAVIVEKGVLELNNSTGATIPASLVIGNDADPSNTTVVRELLENNIATSASVTVKASGLFNVNGFSEHCNTLSGSGSVSLGNGRLTVGSDHGTSTYNGIVSGTGGLTKTGGGTFTLTNNNNYSGATQANGGRLIVNGTQAGSGISVAASGSLGGTGTTGPVTSNIAGATVQPGSAATGTLTVSGNVNLVSGRFAARLNDMASPKKDHLLVSGNLNISNATLAPLITGPVSGTPQIIATYGTLSGTFGVVPGCTVNYNYNDGLGANNIAITILNPWIAWLAGYGLDPSTTGAAAADPDNDTVPNAIEFVLGTDPTKSSAAGDLPSTTAEGTNLVFTFRRSGAAAYLNPVAQLSTSLANGSWSDVTTGISINPGYYSPGIDRVTVTIPRNSRARLFCRLKAVIP